MPVIARAVFDKMCMGELSDLLIRNILETQEHTTTLEWLNKSIGALDKTINFFGASSPV